MKTQSPIIPSHIIFVPEGDIAPKGLIAVIPAYNEELVIGSVVLRTRHYVQRVIVVDDGSSDRTSEVAKMAGAEVIRLDANTGKAYALLLGLKHAHNMGCKAAVMLEADGQHDPREIPRVAGLVLDGNADLVIGSRFLRKNNGIPRYRQLGQKTLDLFTNIGANSMVYDALYGSKIRSVLAKHEQGADFMAGGHERASGRIAPCIATGPGATNLVTGIANAYANRQPVLAITGETSTHIFGRGGLQESTGEGGSIDQGALFASITKYHRTVERTDYIVNVLNQASDALLADNPGPVLLSLPFNVQQETVDAAILDSVKTARVKPACRCSDAQIDALAELILAARRPVVVAGYGCRPSGARIAVRSLQAPSGPIHPRRTVANTCARSFGASAKPWLGETMKQRTICLLMNIRSPSTATPLLAGRFPVGKTGSRSGGTDQQPCPLPGRAAARFL